MRDSRASQEHHLTARRMCWDDIPEVLGLAGRTPAAPWLRPDFLSVFQSNETVGYVALVQKRLVGFAVCSIHRRGQCLDLQWGAVLQRLFDWLREGRRGRRRPRLELFALAVAPERPRTEVELALLGAIVRNFGGSAETIQTVIPETSVQAQTFLRTEGFQAICIFRSYFGREDGYLMRRDRAAPSSKTPSTPRVGNGSPSADGAGMKQG